MHNIKIKIECLSDINNNIYLQAPSEQSVGYKHDFEGPFPVFARHEIILHITV